jgi:hypothetical protein
MILRGGGESEPRQGVPAIPGHPLYQDAHLGRDLNHADSHNTRLRLAKSGALLPFH